jgi:carboxymethylenebutenolidase
MFWAEPEKPIGSIILLHEVWGLVPHIETLCKRFSKLGFATFAPDLFWEHKGILVPDRIQVAMQAVWALPLNQRYDLQKVRKLLRRNDPSGEAFEVVSILYSRTFRDRILKYAISSATYAKSKYGRVACVGFCMGGSISARLATRFRSLTACVVFYGEPPDPSEVRKLSSPVLAIHAQMDEIINSKIPAFVEAAIASGKDITLKIYPGTRHGFFNDTNPQLYERHAAQEAWELTEWFLKQSFSHRSG